MTSWFSEHTEDLRRFRVLTGGQAVAEALRQIDPDVFPVYPITPQTPIIEVFAQFVADGKSQAHILTVESEHSAMSAAVGAALAGARAMTATASQGLAYMIEIVYIAASLRAPIVMAVGNRTLSGPINIHGDHSDGMLARDTGAVQIYVKTAQEAYDWMIMGPRIAEHPDVLLPVLIGLDGFTLTHSAEPVEIEDDHAVKKFVGPYQYPYPMLSDTPGSYGAFAMPEHYFEIKRQQIDALDRVEAVAQQVTQAFSDLSGREYALVEGYRMEDAERAMVIMGSQSGTAHEAVDAMRARHQKVGVVTVRMFRPFPRRILARLLAPMRAIAVFDRASTPGSFPPLYLETRASVAIPRIDSIIYGLGGRDLTTDDVIKVFRRLDQPTVDANAIFYAGSESRGKEE
jgi:pyruvate ferredoxin oxidoreductase alpha subunit